MSAQERAQQTRREFLYAGLALPTTFVVASSAGGALWQSTPEVFAQAQPLPPTPACGDDLEVTPRQMEGPFYKRQSPQRTSLREAGITGTPLALTGYVLSRHCQPLVGALLDFWQADDRGHYDHRGYRLRGHQFTDDAGRYHLETIVPGLYPGRTRHIHVKVQAPHRPVLTTQLYFPGERHNAADRIFNPDLLVTIEDSGNDQFATFNFVLDLA